MKIGFKERFSKARKHALARLMDQGKILSGADPGRIPNITLCALLGITYTNGKALEKSSADMALAHWSETGFSVYAPPTTKGTKKQHNSSDRQLMKTATAETMKNRRATWAVRSAGTVKTG